MSKATLEVGVFGAGAIGCFVGGRLAELARARPGVVDVVFVARPTLVEEVRAGGLHLTDLQGLDLRVPPGALRFSSDVGALKDVDVVVVTTKGGDTAAAGAALAGVLRDGVVVVSLQNGVNNATVLARTMPKQKVLAGMVPFNVLRRDGGRFHRGTKGTLVVEEQGHDDARRLVEALVAAGLPARLEEQMGGVLWGKLVVNLNNAINALAGVPLQQMLQQRGYRQIMADVVEEGVAVVVAAGVRPRLDPPLPPAIVPALLRLPDLLFSLVARPLIPVDPLARSSMADDLLRGRKTEVDVLNGEIVRLAKQIGRTAPRNAAVVDLVHAAEDGAPPLSASALRARLPP